MQRTIETFVVSSEAMRLTLLARNTCGVVEWNGNRGLFIPSAEQSLAETLPVRMDVKAARRLSNDELIRYLREEPVFVGSEIKVRCKGEEMLRSYCGNDENIMVLAATAPDGRAALLHYTLDKRLMIAAREEVSLPRLSI